MSITLNGTTGLAGANGSASTPAVQGEDANTGIFFPAADTVAVATAGTERLRVDSSGRVGIGNTSPDEVLVVKTSAGNIKSSALNSGAKWVGTNAANNVEAEFGFQGNPLVFLTNGTERVRIDSNGLKFNGDTAAANALDDYEEGVWSPVIRGTGSNPTVTVTTANTGGVYTKIGDMVFVSFEVRWSAISGGSGNAYISGLPFARNSTQQPDGDRGVLDYYNVTVPSGGYTGVFSVGNTQTNLNISFTRSGAATIDLPVGNLINTNPGFLRGSLAYKTA